MRGITGVAGVTNQLRASTDGHVQHLNRCMIYWVSVIVSTVAALTSLRRRSPGSEASKASNVPVLIGGSTQYIISTSGRPKSLQRYTKLLQGILGLDIAYLPISSPSNDGRIDPQHFANVIRGLNCLGGAISRDIKHTIIPFLDEVDSLAQQVQSVNTVIRVGSKLKGFNTDALGFRQAIIQGLDTAGLRPIVKTAVVYGYGGVSSVVFSVLQDLGIRVHVTGRNLEKAAACAQQHMGVELYQGQPCDLFVNAAPVTDLPLAEAPNFLAALSGCRCAFDHEMPGEMLRMHCETMGIVHIPGTAMYMPQMRLQWGLFLDEIVPKDEIEMLLMRADTNC